MAKKKLSDTAVAVGEPSASTMMAVEYVDVNSITLPENCTVDKDEVERKKKSISETRLLQPITINRCGVVVGGVHRLLAYRELGRDTIPAVRIDCSEYEEALLRIHENTIRRNPKHAEKMEHVKTLKSIFCRHRGRPTKDSEDNSARNSRTSDICVEHGLFSSRGLCEQALYVDEHCIPEVHKLIDSGALTYSFAYKEIAQKIPLNKQKTALHKIEELIAASVDPKGVKREVRARLKKGRSVKRGLADTPSPLAPADRFLVARVAPDWTTDSMEFLKSLPVADYLARESIVCIECPNFRVGSAVKLLDVWGFHYRGILTVYSRGAKRHPAYPLFDEVSHHVVFGTRQKDQSLKKYNRGSPVAINEDDPKGWVIEALDSMFVCMVEGHQGKALDMLSKDEREDWVSWPNTFGKAVQAE